MRGRLYGLDALRGVAALMVAWHHLQSTYNFELVKISAISAVDLFMVISGFVMARTYEPNMPEDFISRRYRRLFATMAVGATLGFCVALVRFGPSVGLVSAFAAILIFMPWPYIGLFAINIPTWSLFAEIVANTLHRWVFLKLKMWWLWAVIGMLALVFSMATFAVGQVSWGDSPGSLAIATARSICCYLIGIVMWRSYGDRSLAVPSFALVGLPVVLIAGAYINVSLFSVAFALFGAPSLLLIGNGLGPSRIAELAGAVSFPLYAIHCPIMAAGFYLGVPALTTFCLCLLAAIGFTHVSGPALKLKLKASGECT